MLVAVLGGLLGILMMIPLRRAFIVKQHGALPYPEGTACAKVLIVGEQGGSNAKTVFLGVGFGFIYQLADAGSQVLVEILEDTRERHSGLPQGGRFARAIADAPGRRLHHRAADRLGDGRRRHHDGAPDRPDDHVFRRTGFPPRWRRCSSSGSPRWSPDKSPRRTAATSVPARWRPGVS